AVDAHLPETKRKAFGLLMESLLALRRENKEVLWSSMIKDTMKRKKPSFNESYHGYRTFSELLEDAAKQGLLDLETEKRSRTYVVTRFGEEMKNKPEPAAVKKKSRRRRAGAKRRATAEVAEKTAVDAAPAREETAPETPHRETAPEPPGNSNHDAPPEIDISEITF